MATLTLDALNKRYPNGNAALHGIDLRVEDGEMIVIVGPSGCGKSTLLRCLAGLETISGGELKIDGERVNEREPAERDIAMVFQNYALYPHMSVAENMAYALKNRGVPKPAREAKVRETARVLGLEALLDRRPRQLSGGQRQRVAMGRAIVREPKVFLFDEPLSNLDAALRVQMRLEIRRLQKRLGTTAIYVTHDQVEAMTLADRLVVMNAGQVEQIGTPMTLYQRPATRFVAGFIGSPAMNFLPLEQGVAGWRLPGGACLDLDGLEGQPSSLGVRPEHLRESDAETALFDVRVELIEPLGADTLAYCRLDGTSTPLVVRLDGARQLDEGERLRLDAGIDRLHLFDAEGRRLERRPLDHGSAPLLPLSASL
ncbi:sn-glycerol-3-phosphate import ATP-binding protein UgpC [Halotalea alkalilenta]|uniref:Glycerol-3-phosphate ABC transporter ATP-binding protein n=1 Tax=Halotalea alkalilenta TaxID=376489 RepID=A0A172YB26_9GAMM|nr:sn-glycerol-3-phosphate import ATP-binding protein UgpC [Halotalea alkalilenta]ANF56453.1 glycerol-3-phosphate ABC transporter ATP-binding protein [Halotalea alkalilenta]